MTNQRLHFYFLTEQNYRQNTTPNLQIDFIKENPTQLTATQGEDDTSRVLWMLMIFKDTIFLKETLCSQILIELLMLPRLRTKEPLIVLNSSF